MKEYQEGIKNKRGKDLRSQEEYYKWMKKWNQVRDKKVEDMAVKQGMESITYSTFKPQISQKSDYIMKKKPNRVPVY